MENTSYNKSKPTETPNPYMKKNAEDIAMLEGFGVSYENSMKALELRKKLKYWIDSNMKREVVN